MNKRNYQKELENLILKLRLMGTRPKLLLHCCCAPCASYCLTYLAKDFDITCFYYNPNIAPKKEFDSRREELIRLINTLNDEYGYDIKFNDFMENPYDPKEFQNAVKGVEQVPEGGERCFRCFELRLEETAQRAVMCEADFFATTLTISPLKNAQKINEIGEKIAEKYENMKFLPSDFKKNDGYKKSIELSKKYDLYRQDYCGCMYSYIERHKDDYVNQEKPKIGE